MEDLVNLWYQSGKGKNKSKSKGKTLKKSQSKSKNKTHTKKKYVMDEPIPALMKYPSYKRKYECKIKQCNKDWVKFDKCRKNICGMDKIKQTMQDIEKSAIPLNQCLEDKCNRELKKLSLQKGKLVNLSDKKFEKFINCSTKNCGKESKKVQRDLNKNPQYNDKEFINVTFCLTDKCDKLNQKYYRCEKTKCSDKTSSKAKKSRKQSSGQSKNKTKINIIHSNKKITKKTHTKQNFLNISRIKA